MSADLSTDITVEIAYASKHEQLIITIHVLAGITAESAIKASGILDKFPEINLAHHKIGIFGKIVHLDLPLRHQDRVEIYRPLIANPKEVRRQRVVAGKLKK